MKKFGGYIFFSYSLHPTTHYNITINANKEGTHAFIPMMTFWKVSDP